MRIFIFAQLDDETGGRCARHVHQYRTRARNLRVPLVEARPIERHPVIAGVTAKDRPRLKTNHCFPAIPDPSAVVTLTPANKPIPPLPRTPAPPPYTSPPPPLHPP